MQGAVVCLLSTRAKGIMLMRLGKGRTEERITQMDSVVAEQANSGDAASAQSTGKTDPQAPGWIRRVRVGKQPPDRALCPERVCALEQTIRSYADKLGDHVIEPEIGLTFDSLGEAYDFYNLYSWELGFGIRYGKSRFNVEKTKCMQEVVYGCSGKPIKENIRSCRCECPAMIRLLRSHDNGWYITEHVLHPSYPMRRMGFVNLGYAYWDHSSVRPFYRTKRMQQGHPVQA